MRKNASLIFSLFFCLIALSASVSAQKRQQTVEQGISLLGDTKAVFQSYLTANEFHFDNQTGDVASYAKKNNNGIYRLGFTEKDHKITVVSWTENAAFLQDCLSELKRSGFSSDEHENDGAKLYTFKNHARNILATLILRPGFKYITITVGKLKENGLIVKKQEEVASSQAIGSVAGREFIVIAPKAYFYDLTSNGLNRRKAYLVEGEKVDAQSEQNQYIYCEFTNASTKATTKGWIAEECLGSSAKIPATPAIAAASPYHPFLMYDGQLFQDVKFFNNPTAVALLKQLLKGDYQRCLTEFLSFANGPVISVRNKVLILPAFIPNAGPHNKMLLFIDLANEDSFLYWDDRNGNVKYYGKTPVSNNMLYVMRQQLNNNEQYKAGADRLMLLSIIVKAKH